MTELNRIRICNILQNKDLLNKDIKVLGWVRTKRISKEIVFIELNDGSCFKSLQIVADFSQDISELTTGSSVQVVGILQNSQGLGQDIELKSKELKVISKADSDYPLQKKRHSFEFLREIPHIRNRANTFRAVNSLRNHVGMSIHNFFQTNGFYWISTPIITSQDGEGGSSMFQVTSLDLEKLHGKVDYKKDYFKTKTYLSVTGQLYVEPFVHVYDRVYTFGPTFRSENHNTSRHISEFWMIEPEVAFIQLNDLIILVEDFVKNIIKSALELKEEMIFFDSFIEKGLINKLEGVLNSKFFTCTYTDALNELVKHNEDFEFKLSWGDDLQKEHENFITDKMFKGNPVMVIDYPKDIKAFYMKLNEDKKTVQGLDLLVPKVGEIIGGSMREENFEILEKKIDDFGLKKQDYQWYLDLRRFGSVPHGGFGLGFERVLMYLSGMQNIRDVIAYPRTPGPIGI